MKDYTEGKNENFILNYKKKGNKLTINFANKLKKKKLVIDDTLENKNIILKQMKSQLENINEEELRKSIKSDKKAILFFLPLVAIGFVMTISYITSHAIPLTIMFGSITTFFTVMNIIAIKELIKNVDCLKNIEYNKNEEILNQKIKTDKNLLNNTTKRVKKIVNNSKEENVFDLNIIDKLSYLELKQLLEAISKIDTFKFEQTKEEKRIKLEK